MRRNKLLVAVVVVVVVVDDVRYFMPSRAEPIRNGMKRNGEEKYLQKQSQNDTVLYLCVSASSEVNREVEIELQRREVFHQRAQVSHERGFN